MYKKYATYVLLCNMVILMAGLCVQGITINKKAVEAFTVTRDWQPMIQTTSFLGVSEERSSKQRVLEANLVTKERKISITQSEYEELLRIVEAEAGGEDIIGKMLVANVVVNRVESDAFPDNFHDVIFQTDGKVAQFSPISDGRFYTVTVSAETIEAVNRVLQGEDNSRGALYFAARKSANKENMMWFDENLQKLFAYGGHEFFF